MGTENIPERQPDQIDVKVRLPKDVFAAWRQLALRHGWSMTEELREQISRGVFVEEQHDAGKRLVLEDGKVYRSIHWNTGERPNPNLTSDDLPDPDGGG